MAAVKEFSVEEKLSSLVRLQKIDCKLDEIQILKVDWTNVMLFKMSVYIEPGMGAI